MDIRYWFRRWWVFMWGSPYRWARNEEITDLIIRKELAGEAWGDDE